MQTRNQTIKKIASQTTYFSNGTSSTTYIGPTTDWTFNLTVSNPGQLHGDRKSPYPIQFSTTTQQYCTGQSGTIQPGSVVVTAGPSPYGSVSTLSAAYSFIAYNQALEKLYNQLRGQVDLSIDLAEAGQTRRMFRSAARLTRYVRNVSPKNWANNWLEYQYGWKPLVQDLFEAAKEVNRVLPSMFRIVATGKDYDSRRVQVTPSRAGCGTEVRFTSGQTRCRFDCLYQIKPTVLSQLGDFGSLNPISLAWELCPYSFVFDWMIDIGSYLRNLETAALYSQMFLRGYYTEGYKFSSTNQMSGSTYTSFSNRTDWVNLNGSLEEHGKRRTVLSGTPIPRMPQFSAHLGWQRLVSAASLLSQHVGGKQNSRIQHRVMRVLATASSVPSVPSDWLTN